MLTQQVPSHLEVVSSMETFAREILQTQLKPINDLWQPCDFLPNFAAEDGREKLAQLQESARALSDELLIVLIGDMVTEEALPSYQNWLNNLEGMRDLSGVGNNAWAEWTRGWSAEENRHGELLNKYLYLTGRVNMRAVETTIQYLIRNGFDPETENDPYLGFVYTSFQETATKVSHRNTAILAARAGESRLREICGTIAGDEARHETAYKMFMNKIFELDPSGAVIAFAKMMKTKIVMPAKLMSDGQTPQLFDQFSVVAQKIGVYTAVDYSTILESLVDFWNVKNLSGLSSEARQAQDYVCSLAGRYRRLAERIKLPEQVGRFSWIYNRAV